MTCVGCSQVTYEAFDAMKGCDFSSPIIKGIATTHGVGISQVRCTRLLGYFTRGWLFNTLGDSMAPPALHNIVARLLALADAALPTSQARC